MLLGTIETQKPAQEERATAARGNGGKASGGSLITASRAPNNRPGREPINHRFDKGSARPFPRGDDLPGDAGLIGRRKSLSPRECVPARGHARRAFPRPVFQDRGSEPRAAKVLLRASRAGRSGGSAWNNAGSIRRRKRCEDYGRGRLVIDAARGPVGKHREKVFRSSWPRRK